MSGALSPKQDGASFVLIMVESSRLQVNRPPEAGLTAVPVRTTFSHPFGRGSVP